MTRLHTNTIACAVLLGSVWFVLACTRPSAAPSGSASGATDVPGSHTSAVSSTSESVTSHEVQTIEPPVGNDDPRGAGVQPNYDEEARALRERVARHLPHPLPERAQACNQMLTTVIEHYRRTERKVDASHDPAAVLQQTRTDEVARCMRETSPAAAACVTAAIGREREEFAWLLDLCSRAFPNDAPPANEH